MNAWRSATRRLTTALAVLVPGVLVGSSVHAGESNPPPVMCLKQADGSGYCAGTLMAFRTSASSNAHADFDIYTPTLGTFMALTPDGVSAYCVTNSVPTAWYTLVSASANTYFRVHWDK